MILFILGFFCGTTFVFLYLEYKFGLIFRIEVENKKPPNGA